MDPNDEAVRLFNAYRGWWLQTSNIQARRQKHPVTPHKMTPERLELFRDMVYFCREKKLDPRLWLYLLFRVRRWTFAPRLTRGCLLSEKMVSRYNRMIAKECLDGYRRITYQKDTLDFDPNRDLSSRAEALKLRYEKYSEKERCMLETPDRTYGFHPESKVCQRCLIRQECLQNLQNMVSFDILALREGRITADQAKATVE